MAALRRVLIAALLGNVLVNAVLQLFVVRALILPLTIILALTVVIVAVCATRWCWAPLLAALWCVIAVVPGLKPYSYNLAHPAEAGTFVATVLGLAMYLVAIVAGVTATVTRGSPGSEASRPPRWLRGFLIGVGAFAVGASLVSMIPSSDASAGVSAEELAGLPAVDAAHTRFEPMELHAKVGETVALRLDNHDAERHYFDIDEFNVHVPMPPGRSALALFRPTTPGTYTFYCEVPGHRSAGMHGTLIVEP
jgi:uncharacterized cupredoxin-like copper-binding protein